MSKIPIGEKGYVYAMSCGWPNMLKIGVTTDLPVERARQLTASTSSPSPFVVVYSRQVADCNLVEEILHERFSDRRVNAKREFFNVSLEEVARSMDQLAKMYPYIGAGSAARMSLPWSELFATFDQDGPPELTPEERRKCRELAAQLHVT